MLVDAETGRERAELEPAAADDRKVQEVQ